MDCIKTVQKKHEGAYSLKSCCLAFKTLNCEPGTLNGYQVPLFHVEQPIAAAQEYFNAFHNNNYIFCLLGQYKNQ